MSEDWYTKYPNFYHTTFLFTFPLLPCLSKIITDLHWHPLIFSSFFFQRWSEDNFSKQDLTTLAFHPTFKRSECLLCTSSLYCLPMFSYYLIVILINNCLLTHLMSHKIVSFYDRRLGLQKRRDIINHINKMNFPVSIFQDSDTTNGDL